MDSPKYMTNLQGKETCWTLDDVDSVLCMVLVFEFVLSPLFLFGIFGLLVWTGLNTDVLMSLSIVILDLESGENMFDVYSSKL
jgi:hypothetical protein